MGSVYLEDVVLVAQVVGLVLFPVLLMALVGLETLSLALCLVSELPVDCAAEVLCSLGERVVALCLEVSHPGLEVGRSNLDGVVVARSSSRLRVFLLLVVVHLVLQVGVQPSRDFLASLEEALLALLCLC